MFLHAVRTQVMSFTMASQLNESTTIESMYKSDSYHCLEGILALRVRRNKRLYLVQWAEGSRTWEPRAHLFQDIPGLVRRVDAIAATHRISKSFDLVFEYPCTFSGKYPPRTLRNYARVPSGIKRLKKP